MHATNQAGARCTAGTGLDVLGLSLQDLPDLNVAPTCPCLGDDAFAVAWSRGLMLSVDTSSDAGKVARGAALRHELLHATTALGCRMLSDAVYSSLRMYAGRPTPAERAITIAVIRELRRRVQAFGVAVSVGVIGRSIRRGPWSNRADLGRYALRSIASQLDVTHVAV